MAINSNLLKEYAITIEPKKSIGRHLVEKILQSVSSDPRLAGDADVESVEASLSVRVSENRIRKGSLDVKLSFPHDSEGILIKLRND